MRVLYKIGRYSYSITGGNEKKMETVATYQILQPIGRHIKRTLKPMDSQTIPNSQQIK